MAEKFSAKKPQPQKTHPTELIIALFFAVTILTAVAIRFFNFSKITFAKFIGVFDEQFLINLFQSLKFLSLILSVFVLGAIILVYRKYGAANRQLMASIEPPSEITYDIAAPAKEYVNPKWLRVLEHINSPNSGDWKLAILEADIMLHDMLDKMGYHGATIGDKLKSIEPSDFTSLQEAWEAHKIRNSIAHEGSDYAVNKPEAERVVKLFKKVFEEFKYI